MNVKNDVKLSKIKIRLENTTDVTIFYIHERENNKENYFDYFFDFP